MIETFTVANTEFRVIQTFGQTYLRRGAAFSVQAAAYNNSIDRDMLSQGMDKIIEAADKKFTTDVIQIAGYIKSLLQEDNLIRPLLKIANTFVLMPDEPEKEVSPYHDIQKLQLCEANKEIEFFFASTCIDMLKRIAILSKDTSVEDYLGQSQKRQLEESSLQRIGSGIYKK